MSQPGGMPRSTSEHRATAFQRWPLLGALSWLVAPLVLTGGHAAAQASAEVGRFLTGSAGVAVGVLASCVLGLLCTIGSRVRRERWPWLGIVGAVISALPLLLFLAGRLFRL